MRQDKPEVDCLSWEEDTGEAKFCKSALRCMSMGVSHTLGSVFAPFILLCQWPRTQKGEGAAQLKGAANLSAVILGVFCLFPGALSGCLKERS